MTQTPASGPLGPVTVPPMSFAEIFTAAFCRGLLCWAWRKSAAAAVAARALKPRNRAEGMRGLLRQVRPAASLYSEFRAFVVGGGDGAKAEFSASWYGRSRL